MTELPTPEPLKKNSFLPWLILVFFLFLILAGLAVYLLKFNRGSQSPLLPEKLSLEIPNRFAHYQYLPKPQFKNALPSSIASPDEYSFKGSLPSAEEVIKRPRAGLVSPVWAGGPIPLPVWQANRYAVDLGSAQNLAQKFNFAGEPQKIGYEPPAYYGFIWDTPIARFEVTGGSGTGGFEYYLKGSQSAGGQLPSENEATTLAREFLKQKGVIDDSYITSGPLHNVSDISSRSGFQENHLQVYFRKKLEGYPVYDWSVGGGSPITGRLEVWVGLEGRILYAAHTNYWTSVNSESKKEYLVREPAQVFEDIKAGKGNLAWIDYEAIGVSTGGYGQAAPAGNFTDFGKLSDVVMEDVNLAYYHESKGIDEPEFYQPIYLFTAKATLGWKEAYRPSEAEKFIQGKRTVVTFVASAIPDDYFWEKPKETAIAKKISPAIPPAYYPPAKPTAHPSPTLYPESTPLPTPIVPPVASGISQDKQSFVLKLGLITPLEDPKRNVVLSWENVAGAIKYNLYLKLIGEEQYQQTAVLGTGNLSETIGVNKYIDYYFKVKACDLTRCIESDEVFLPQEQKPTFTLNLGVITPREDPKIEIQLTWTKVSGTIKYNVFLKNSLSEDYGAALAGIEELNYLASVNRHNDNYFIVQACGLEVCQSSNEVVVPKQ